ncbi:cytosolic carboxypeptidase 1-like isoform X2 [Tigriopus californicus]|nr:cytosolic carboxypeptidase 1-like isoform X2 [Tigriopus californicus]
MEDQVDLLEALWLEANSDDEEQETIHGLPCNENLQLDPMSETEQTMSIRRMTAQISLKLLQERDSGARSAILLTMAANINHVKNLLQICELSKDPKTTTHELFILRDGVAAKTLWRSQNLSHLIALNATEVLARRLVHFHQDESLSESGVISAFWILSALATKDSKFSWQFGGALKIINPLLKRLACKSLGLYPILQVVKALARNTDVAQSLGGQGVVQTIVVVFRQVILKKKFCPKIKVALEALFMLAKCKYNVNLLVAENLSRDLLEILQSHKANLCQKRQTFKISGSILNILLHIISNNQGKANFLRDNGTEILKSFCQDLTIKDRRGDRLLSRSWTILSKCRTPKLLPIADDFSPMQFDAPEVHWKKRSSGCYSSATSRETTPDTDDDEVADDEYEDEYEYEYEYEDGEDEEDAFAEEMPGALTGLSKTSSKVFKAQKRSDDELRASYDKFFIELQSLMGGNGTEESTPSLSSSVTELYDQLHTERVCGLYLFEDIALPDRLFLNDASGPEEFLHQKNCNIYREKLLKVLYNECKDNSRSSTNLNSFIHDNDEPSVDLDVVYDLDQLLDPSHSNVGFHSRGDSLQFESRFESGNLRKVIRLVHQEYNLILTPDVNTAKHHQWFYFSVKNMRSDQIYTFNIINYEKTNSQFNFGMQPVMFSQLEYEQRGLGWTRVGQDVIYYKNEFSKSMAAGSNYMTASFKIQFPHSTGDVCYLAYHFPYTYTRLLTHLEVLQCSKSQDTYLRIDSLNKTLNNHDVPLITITSNNDNARPLLERKLVVLTSRVHPGETNASFMMEGVLDQLVSDSQLASVLRSNFIFKLVPMLNVEGVINGCHRCGLTGDDLNRQWDKPHPILHPSVYHAKGILAYCHQILKTSHLPDKKQQADQPFLFCDFHGHSRKKSIFLYGCSGDESWLPSDSDRSTNSSHTENQNKMLADLLHNRFQGFERKSCRYAIEKSRESTARVVVWREFKVQHSYTLESTFCGFSKHEYKGQQIKPSHLSSMGKCFVNALLELAEEQESTSVGERKLQK